MALYRDAIKQIADARRLAFADLFHVLGEGKESLKDLTDNGVHFTDAGYKQTTGAFARALGLSEDAAYSETLDPVRQAIRKKNELYFYRWRPQNETYLFGFRKHEQGHLAPEVPQFDPLVAEKEALRDADARLMRLEVVALQELYRVRRHDRQTGGLEDLFQDVLGLGSILRLVPGDFFPLGHLCGLRAREERAAASLHLVEDLRQLLRVVGPVERAGGLPDLALEREAEPQVASRREPQVVVLHDVERVGDRDREDPAHLADGHAAGRLRELQRDGLGQVGRRVHLREVDGRHAQPVGDAAGRQSLRPRLDQQAEDVEARFLGERRQRGYGIHLFHSSKTIEIGRRRQGPSAPAAAGTPSASRRIAPRRGRGYGSPDADRQHQAPTRPGRKP